MNRRNALKNTALLAGVSISGTAVSALFQSCQKENPLEWTPQFFTPEQARTVSALVDVILPRTSTPGALDLKVDIFVDAMIQKALSPADQQHIMKGYREFVTVAQDLYHRSFPELKPTEKQAVVNKAAAASNRFNPSIWGSPIGEQSPVDFFRRIKQFTLLGYFTSEEIGKNVLVYDPVPGEFNGCIPVDQVGNAWTL